jgi:tetratricopeptide (TPR) repeat protein
MAALSSDAAFAKRALGRPAEAEALWQEALGYAPRIPPKYRGQTIAPRTFLAQLYMDRGDVAKADPLASEAVRELRSWGGDRVSLAQTLIDLGTIRRLQIRYAEAEALIQEGTNLFALAVGNDHPNVAYGLLSLSSLHYYESKFDQAAQEARQALNIVKKLPPGTNYYAAVYNALGRALNGAGRSTEAEPLLREALAIRRKYPRRGDIASALGSLGECLVAQKRYAEAEPLLVESYQILMVQHVPESPVLREARDRLVSVHAALDKSSMPIH